MFGGKDRKDKEKERKDKGVKNVREGRRWVLMSTCVFFGSVGGGGRNVLCQSWVFCCLFLRVPY